MEIITTNERNALRSFDELSEQDKAKVIQKKEQLNYHDTSAIIQFGAEDANDLSEFSSNLFKGFNVANFSEFEGAVQTLMSNLKQVDTNSLAEVHESRWENFPVIGKMLKQGVIEKVNEAMMKHTSIEKVIEEVVTSLEKLKYEAIKDMKLSNEMRKKAYDYSDAQELNYLAIESAKQEAEKERAELEANFNEYNLRDVNELADINNSISSLERKAVAIQTYRLMSLQSLPKLTYIHNASQAIVTKIEDIIINVIPQWRQQFCLAIFAFHIKNSAYVLENVRVATEEIYRQNGLLLKDAMLYTAKEIEALPVSLEALKQVNEQMISLCGELEEIEENAKIIRKEAIPEIEKLQQEVLNIESKK